MPTVWIANEAGHPYDKVRILLNKVRPLYIRPLTLDDVNPLEIDRLNWHLARGIVHYVKPDDYLLISGTPMVNAAAYAMWLLHHGKCQVIQWNAKLRRYELKVIDRNDLGAVLERQLLRS